MSAVLVMSSSAALRPNFSSDSERTSLARLRTALFFITRVDISSKVSLDADCKYSLATALAIFLVAFSPSSSVISLTAALVAPLIPPLTAPAAPRLTQLSGSETNSKSISLPRLPVS